MFFLPIAILVASIGCGPNLDAHIGHAGGTFTKVAQFSAPGGPSEIQRAYLDPSGKEHLFVGYTYITSPADLVEFIPGSSGMQCVAHPLPADKLGSEYAYQVIHCINIGKDKKLYLTVSPVPKVIQYDPETQKFTVLGGDDLPTVANTGYCWDLFTAQDGTQYGVATPSATFFKVDPVSLKLSIIAKLKDLGAKSETARWVVVGPDGWVYIRVGTYIYDASFWEYNPTSGKPPFQFSFPGHEGALALVHGFYWPKEKNVLYADMTFQDVGAKMPTTTSNFEVMKEGVPTHVPKMEGVIYREYSDALLLPGVGYFDQVTPGSHSVTWRPFVGTKQTYTMDYTGRPLRIFHLGMGPDKAIYASISIPAEVFRYADGQIKDLGAAGPGECFGIFPFDNKVLLAVYGGHTNIALADANASPGTDPITFVPDPADQLLQSGWRPIAGFVEPNNTTAWIGSAPNAEQKSGQLAEVKAGPPAVVTEVTPLPDTAISCVIGLPPTGGQSEGTILLGTSRRVGSQMQQSATSQGELYLFDPQSRKVISSGVAPVPGERCDTIINLYPLGGNQYFGMARLVEHAGEHARVASFVINIQGDTITPLNSKVYGLDFSITTEFTFNAITRVGSLMWGLENRGVFSIDPASLALTIYPYKDPDIISAGFAADGNDLYFGSMTNLVKFHIQ